MKGTIITLLAITAVIALWIMKPWEARRYDDTPAGIEAKKIDKHVQDAKNWRPPNTMDFPEFLGPTDDPKRNYEIGMSWTQATAMGKAFKAAGATEVAYMNIKRGSRSGDNPEGFFVAVPDDPAKRKAIFALAASWPKPPKDVKQKYIYYGIQGWSPDDPESSFLGD